MATFQPFRPSNAAEAILSDFVPPQGPVPSSVPFEDGHIDRAGLTLRYRIWGDPQKPPVLLQHGSRDHARSWDFVVADLVADYCLITPDLRGHGDSDHVPGGGYDALDQVADFAAVVADLENRGIGPGISVVGHSLGGNIASHYIAAFPEKVRAFVNIEGVGTPPSLYQQMLERPAGERWRAAADKLLAANVEPPRVFATPDLAVRRMRMLHGNVDPAIVEYLALHAIRSTDKGFSWKYDPLLPRGAAHRPEPPDEYLALYQSVRCPVLMIYGGASFATPPDQDGRGKVFPDSRLIVYEDAGHWLHHERFEDFVRDIRAFLAEVGRE